MNGAFSIQLPQKRLGVDKFTRKLLCMGNDVEILPVGLD